MTIKTTGPLTFTEIVAEFGDTTPPIHGLSEFYAGGANVPAGTVGFPAGVSTPIPASGTIAYSNFYGAAKITGLKGSLRFRGASYLSKTRGGTAGSTTTATVSTWIKRGSLTSLQTLFSTLNNHYVFRLGDNAGDKDALEIYDDNFSIITDALLRDTSAWYHLVLRVDTTKATATDRVVLWINGVQAPIKGRRDPAQNATITINATSEEKYIGREFNGGNVYNGYMTEINVIDGQALDATSFGQLDSNGMWIPKKYSGTYGTTGFHLAFDKSTAPTDLGKDSSGNNNDWNVNGFSLAPDQTYDVMRDVPNPVDEAHGNYCTLNPLDNNSALSFCNLIMNGYAGQQNQASGTMSVNSGKWYFEWKSGFLSVGVKNVSVGFKKANSGNVPAATNFYVYDSDGQVSGVGGSRNYGAAFGAGNVMAAALDCDAGTLTFYKDNVSQGVAFTGLTGLNLVPFVGVFQQSDVGFNFGQQPFKHTPPTGFKPLNTFNLP